MPTTTTIERTLKQVLDDANPQDIADALRAIRLGTTLRPLKRTFTGLTSSATQNLTLIDGTGETAGLANANRLAALCVATLRVTAGTLAAGAALVTDTGGTPLAIGTTNNHVVTISDDGKILTFQAAVTGFVITYVPRIKALADFDAAFASKT